MSKHHHRHHKDYATTFKERNLRLIAIQRLAGKILKIVLFVITILMVIAVIASRFIQ